ncbi:MAG: hypothetical protein RL292_202 [Candidatus Parcubacteria bacterium]|jgi:hypothetical protein
MKKGVKMHQPRIDLGLSTDQLCELSPEHQHELGVQWDKINSDLTSFVAREKRGNATYNEILTENIGLRQFASSQIKKVCSETTSEDAYRRAALGKIALMVGYGQGWDSDTWWGSDWLKDVTRAGLQTWWLDVSPFACAMASVKTAILWENLKNSETFGVLPPVVKNGEVRSVLINPGTVGLTLFHVEVFYLCRTLFALSKESVRICLQIMGSCLSEDSDFEKKKRVILINPLKDDNPQRQTKTSISLSRKMILSNLRRGADRPLKVAYDYHWYFERRYTAMIIRAE